MKCPVCSASLTTVSASDVQVDACDTGCGGIWFDKNELEKFDHLNEDAPISMLRPTRNAQVVIDRSKERMCPRCGGGKMARHYRDDGSELEIDFCEKCSGVWLDIGELNFVRGQNANAEEYDRVIAETHRAAAQSNAPRGLKAVLKLLFK